MRPSFVQARTLVLAVALLASGCDDGAVEIAAEAHATGAMLRELGRVERAIEAFDRALAHDPTHEPSLIALGEIAEARGDMEAALGSYRIAAAEHDAGPEAHRQLARLQRTRGDLSEALRYAIAAYRLAPRAPGVLAEKALVMRAIGNLDAAVSAARRAVLLVPDHVGATLTLVEVLTARDGRQAALEAIEASPVRDRLPLVEARVGLLDRLGRPQEAIDCLRAALAGRRPRDPDAGALARKLAQRLISAGRLDEAGRVLDARLAGAPDDLDTILARADLILAREGLAAAETMLERRIEAAGHPVGALAHRRLHVLLLIADGRHERAQALFGDDAGSVRGVDGARAALRQARRWLDASAPVPAFELARAALAAAPADQEPARLVADLALALGRVSEGAQALDGAVEALGARARTGTLVAAARLAAATGRVAAAQDMLDRAIARSAGAVEAIEAKARLLARQARVSTALSLVEEAVTARPGSAALAALRGDLLLDAGRITEAGDVALTLLDGAGRLGDPEAGAAGAALLADVLDATVQDDRREGLARRALARAPGSVALRLQLATLGGSHAARHVVAAMRRAPGEARSYLLAAERAEARGEPQAALVWIERGLERVGRTDLLRLHRARLLESLGRAAEAIAEYEILHALAPASVTLANNLASLLAERGGAPDMARAEGLAARLRHFDVPAYLDTLGWIELHRGDRAAAIALLERAARALPENATVHRHLALAYRLAGRTQEAASMLRRAMALDTSRRVGYEIRAVEGPERPTGGVGRPEAVE